MLTYARKNPNSAKRLLEIMQSESREQDLKCVQGSEWIKFSFEQ